MTLTLLITIMLVAPPIATAGGKVRPLEVRIGWLKQRLQQHRYVCLHGNHRWPRVRWHCKAITWTERELWQAQAQWESNWRRWLPAKWYRVGSCETGYGGDPDWAWDSGTYVSAFGIVRGAYDQFAHALGLPGWDGHRPPSEQYEVASAIEHRFGFGAWGCGNA